MRNHSLGPPTCFHDMLILGQPVWVMCLGCGRARRQYPSSIKSNISLLPFNHAARKFRCNGCSSKRIIILSLDGDLLGR